METTKKPPTLDPSVAAYQESSKRADYRPILRGGKVRIIDGTGRYIGEAVPIRGAKRLTLAIRGNWQEFGSACCPVCGVPQMVITADSQGVITVVCPAKCHPADIYEALLNLGIATTMWVS